MMSVVVLIIQYYIFLEPRNEAEFPCTTGT